LTTARFSLNIFKRSVEQEEEGQATGVFQLNIDPKIATFGLLGMCNWLSQWYKSSGQYSPQQIAAMFVNMVERGLLFSSALFLRHKISS